MGIPLPFSEAALISALGSSWKGSLVGLWQGRISPSVSPSPQPVGPWDGLWVYLDGSWVLLMRPPWRLRWAWRRLAVLLYGLFSWAGGSVPGPCLEGPFARKMGDVEPGKALAFFELLPLLLPGAPLLSWWGRGWPGGGGGRSVLSGPPLTASVAHLGKGIQPQIWERRH